MHYTGKLKTLDNLKNTRKIRLKHSPKMKRSYILFCAALLFTLSLCAEIKMPRIFSDNMVLQRGVPVKVWGWASPGSDVTVSFSGQTKTAKANAKGEWLVELSPLRESVEASEISISESGGAPKQIKNVLVGDVWISGGQSNMEFAAKRMDGANDFLSELKGHPVRFFVQKESKPSKVPMEDTGKNSKWFDCKSDDVSWLSAVALIFARDISAKTGVPIGVIDSSFSGTNMYSWLPQEVFDNDPLVEHERVNWKNRLKNYNYQKALEKWQKGVDEYEAAVAKAKAEGKPVPPQHYSTTLLHKPRPDSPDLFRTRCELYNARIYPIKRYAARGILWYQGENDGYMKKGFRESFMSLINAWRQSWGNPDMPFISVQLPSWGSDAPWAEIRQQQYEACRNLKNTGIVVTIDTGEKDDIHPTEKLPIGHRAAAIALHDVYGFKDIAAYGPIMKDVKFIGKLARVEFSGGNLECKGEPRGFEVLCGGKWIPAKAKVKKDCVLLRAADSNSDIEGVRYLWETFAKPNVCLYSNDIPAMPFIKEK